MQTLEAAGCDAGTADTKIQLRPDSALLCVRALDAGAELGVLRGGAGVRTGQPERRRKRLSLVVEGTLLGDRGTTERTPNDDTTERARGTA